MYRVSILLTAVMIAGGITTAAYAESASVLLEKGIYQEDTVGNLQSAMDIYQQIIADQQANRPFVAQAYYRLGMCYLKKNEKTKAAEMFRKLLKDYPEAVPFTEKAEAALTMLDKNSSVYAATFGPVIERTINDLDEGQGHEGLNIQSGKLFDIPKEAKGWSKDQYHQWLAENSIDLLADYAKNRWGLIVYNLKLEGVDRRWDDITPQYLQTMTASETSKLEMIERSGDRIYLLHEKANPPLTYAIKATTGELGVLQIIEFVDKPKGIKIRYKLLQAAPSTPRVVRTTPITLTNDVDPGLNKITVTFDRPMMDKSWSFTAGDKAFSEQTGSIFPERTGEISYDATRTTCTMPVKLQPGKVYWVGINSPSFQGFKAADGTPARHYMILFATKDKDGKPTPLPDKLAKQAREINNRSINMEQDALKARLINWVEKFFSENYRDITARKTLEWGEPETLPNGNLAIRYKYLATIWDKDKLIIDQRFTFKPDGQYVSAETIEKSPATQPDTVTDKVASEKYSAEGWRLWRQQKHAEAEEAFQKAVREDPANTNAWNGLGWAQFNQGKPLAAEEAFKKCLEREPKHAAALNGLGWIEKNRNQNDKAIALWQKALEASPEATAAMNGLAVTSMEMGRYEEAVKYYKMLVEKEPNNKEAKTGLEKAKAALENK